MDDRFWHAGDQLVSRVHQAMILVSLLGVSAAVAWEVPARSGITAEIFRF